jgi:hypothetical protein
MSLIIVTSNGGTEEMGMHPLTSKGSPFSYIMRRPFGTTMEFANRSYMNQTQELVNSTIYVRIASPCGLFDLQLINFMWY